MTAAEAMIDAALTIRIWQREGLHPEQIGRLIRCAANWDAIENAIVTDLLLRDVRRAAPLQRAA